MHHISRICRNIVEFLHHTDRHTLLHTHLSTHKFDTQNYTQRIDTYN